MGKSTSPTYPGWHRSSPLRANLKRGKGIVESVVDRIANEGERE